MASCAQVNSFLQAHVDGELDPSEERVLSEHLEHCAACRAEVDHVASWHRDLVGACSMHRLQRSLRGDVLAHLPEMEPALHHGSHPTDPRIAPKRYSFRWPLALTAAAAMGLIVLAAAILAPSNTELAPGRAIGMVVSADGPGTLYKSPGATQFAPAALKSMVTPGVALETLDASRLALALARGSSIKMNDRTAVTIRDSRNVSVHRGQAYFSVGRDREHFYVNTPTGEILVFGTSFAVDVRADVTTVIVVEGDVLVSTPEGRSALSRGKQTALRRGFAPTAPVAAHNDELIAWVSSIDPDAGALALFNETIAARESVDTPLPDKAVHAVRNLRGRDIERFLLEWVDDGFSSGHCGYFLHVTDSDDNLLFLDTIPGSVFDDPAQHALSFYPDDKPISGVEVIHIRLIPDHATGTIESEITVNAVVR